MLLPHIDGFKVVVFTDHRHNFFIGNLSANRRTNKELLRWAVDVEHWCDAVQRIWIKLKKMTFLQTL